MDTRFALAALLVLAPLTTAVPQQQISAKPAMIPITIPQGRISRVVTGALNSSGSVVYTLAAKAGQTLAINAYGTTKGFDVIATVAFPKGGQDGDKGTPNYAAKLTQSGTYKITVARNLMASTVQSGSFGLEVVLY